MYAVCEFWHTYIHTYTHTYSHTHTHTQVALGTENIRAPFGIPFAQDPEDEVEDKSYEKHTYMHA
jgi:hypothetical protein